MGLVRIMRNSHADRAVLAGHKKEKKNSSELYKMETLFHTCLERPEKA
jgi:hypothetical protein